MMISSFSSYLEFIAAVYTSMYFDKVFDFWSPKYKIKLSKSLDNNNWTNDTLFSSTLNEASSKWYEGVRKSMLNRSAFMIFSIVAMLIFTGFENTIDNNVITRYYTSFILTWAFTILVILVVCNRFFFSKVKRMFFAFGIEILVFILIYTYIVPNVDSITFLSEYLRISLLIFTLLPVTFQIFISWLSSEPYAEYIKKRLPSFKTEYDKAQKCLETHDLSLLNSDFKEVISEMFVRGESCDTSMAKYQEFLQEKMLIACQPKSIFVVFVSWIVFQYEYKKRKIFKNGAIEVNANETVYEMPIEYRKHEGDIDFAKEYKKYRAEKEQNSHLNIRDYCKRHNISYSAMKSWVKANNPSK